MSMPLRASALAAALAVVAAECDVCHLHYYHKVRRFVRFFAFSRENHSSEPRALPSHRRTSPPPKVFSSDVTTCREYKDEACCTADTAKGYVRVPHPPTRYPDNPSDMSGLGLGLFSVADAARDARESTSRPTRIKYRFDTKDDPRDASRRVGPETRRPGRRSAALRIGGVVSGHVTRFCRRCREAVASARPPLTPRTLPQLSQRGRRPEGLPLPRSQREQCGGLTSACEQFFIEEGCFYECDKNLGKAATTTAPRTTPTTTAGKSRAFPSRRPTATTGTRLAQARITSNVHRRHD